MEISQDPTMTMRQSFNRSQLHAMISVLRGRLSKLPLDEQLSAHEYNVRWSLRMKITRAIVQLFRKLYGNE